MKKYRRYRKLVAKASFEISNGARKIRQRSAGEHREDLKEAAKQIDEDRRGLIVDWRQLRESWQETNEDELEPRLDFNRRARVRHWRFGAGLLFAIETALAVLLTRYWIASTVLEDRPALRILLLVVLGLLQTLLVTGVFFKAWSGRDDNLRPIPSLAACTRIAALCSVGSIIALMVFLVTRQFLVGGILFPIALATLTLTLGAGVAAALHCAEILHRPNRLATEYDNADNLLGRAHVVSTEIDRLLSSKEPVPSGPTGGPSTPQAPRKTAPLEGTETLEN